MSDISCIGSCLYIGNLYYSEPLSEEEIFEMVMKAVRIQLNVSTRMPTGKRRSFIRAAANSIVGKLLEIYKCDLYQTFLKGMSSHILKK